MSSSRSSTDPALMDRESTVRSVGKTLISANAYVGCEGTVQALDGGADIVITWRVSDPSPVAGATNLRIPVVPSGLEHHRTKNRCRTSAGMRRPGQRRLLCRPPEVVGLSSCPPRGASYRIPE